MSKKKNIDLLHDSKSIFTDSKKVFERNSITLLTLQPNIHRYIAGYSFSKAITSNQYIDTSFLEKKLKLIWHSIAASQIELGYFLICEMYLNKPDLSEEEITLTNALTLNHLSLTYECIYRVWEKITCVLYYLHYMKSKKKLYYDGLINKLEESGRYDAAVIFQLKKHSKHWNKVACIRNKFSHEESVLFSSEYQPSAIVDRYGIPLYMKEITHDVSDEVSPLIDRFKYLEKVSDSLQNFMDEMPVSRIVRL